MAIRSVLIVLAGLAVAVPFRPFVPATAAVLEQAWNTALGTSRQTTLLRAAVVGEVLLVEDARHGLTALELADGRPRWFVQLQGPLDHWPSPGAGTLTLASGTRSVVVELRTGRRLFELSSAALPAGSPVADRKLMYLPSLLNDTLFAIDMQTGLQAWQYRLPAHFAGGAQLIGGEGRTSVLVGSDDGKLRALPAGADVPQRERWVRRVGTLLAPPTVSGNRIYVNTAGRELIALDAGSGEVAWKHLPGEALVGGPLVAGDRIVVATRTRLLSLRADNGTVQWERPAGGIPAGEAGGALLVRDRADAGELLDADTGERLAAQMPPDLQVGGGLLMGVQDGNEVRAWRVVR